MIRDTFVKIIYDIWPMITIITVIAISLRIAYIINKHQKFKLYSDILYLIFIVYIMCLFHVVTFQDMNYGGSNFVPFKEIFRHELFSSKFIKNIMGNIILFIPYGYFVSYVLKSKKLWYPVTLTLILSISIEVVQYNIGRIFDIDDIILNVLGGFVGYLIFVAIDAVSAKLPKALKRDFFLNILTIFLLTLLLIYFFNINIFKLWW